MAKGKALGEAYEFRVDGRVFEVRVEDGECTTREGGASQPLAAVFTMGVEVRFLAWPHEGAAFTGNLDESQWLHIPKGNNFDHHYSEPPGSLSHCRAQAYLTPTFQ